MVKERYSAYDPFAWFYNKYWALPFTRQIFPVVCKLLLAHLQPRSRVLDVCCGTGHLARLMTQRGFRVTGVDGSAEMLRYARRNVPQAEFQLTDVREFQLPAVYHGAVSIFDSLNHIMDLQGLTAAFQNVHRALRKSGLFVFDMNMEGNYRANWMGTTAIVRADHVCIVRGAYDSEQKIGRCDLTLFRRPQKIWRRADLSICERCYARKDVQAALEEAGFREVSVFGAEKDFDMRGNRGRSIFMAEK